MNIHLWCENALSLSDLLQILILAYGWFSFEMAAAGSVSLNVDALTDFPEFIETTVYSDCDGCVASADALDAGTYFVNVVQTVPEIGDVDFTVSVDVIILGCTDAGAANYNPVATADDESCNTFMVVQMLLLKTTTRMLLMMMVLVNMFLVVLMMKR